ncbi:prevent-host-death protein [Azospirillum sp. TSH7]|uniref:type II toxin-antitoxin system Phd/YefM family antitoxin n=1 Tax=unclassified Azospirillum TaxID=2630922 RepID=UPI000D60ECA3|nr:MULTISPECIES: type II toxin-antitoxin system prevent-host-death family antitoxin [unclassified Azospirillum]PWC65293.1 prevent-host-death protein [Azospirillum sp. TSH7]PWC71804.1 prevent-host-death protein [Azospirillum sp. TSH20]
MRQVTIHAAKTNLSKLIEAALRGEEVVIAKGSKPVVRLVPVSRGAFTIGLLKGKLGTGPDFFEPMDDADLDGWEGEASGAP